MEIALLYGVVAMFAQGVANALLKDATGKLGVLPTVIARSGTSALALWAVFLVLRPEVTFSAELFAFAAALSILGYFPFLFFIKGLEKGKVGVVAPIAAGWIVVAAAVSYFLYAEPFGAGKIAALLLVLAGVVIASVNLGDWKRGVGFRDGVAYAVFAALLWGIVFPLFKIPSEYFGALFFACVIESFVCLSGYAHRLLSKTPLPPKEVVKKNWIPVVSAGILTAIFTLFVSLGYLTGEVALVSAIAGSSIVVSLAFAALFQKERLSALQYAGAGLVLLGIVIASII